MDFNEFLAGDELVEIVPSFKYDKVISLINGDIGPFQPAIPTRVPLWMAINLYKEQKCKINPPSWLMELDKLYEEQAASETLIKMPSDYWRETIKLLESNHIHIPQKYNGLIDIRANILQRSADALLKSVVDLQEDNIAQVKIRNITKYELDTIKGFMNANLAISKNIQSGVNDKS